MSVMSGMDGSEIIESEAASVARWGGGVKIVWFIIIMMMMIMFFLLFCLILLKFPTVHVIACCLFVWNFRYFGPWLVNILHRNFLRFPPPPPLSPSEEEKDVALSLLDGLPDLLRKVERLVIEGQFLDSHAVIRGLAEPQAGASGRGVWEGFGSKND